MNAFLQSPASRSQVVLSAVAAVVRGSVHPRGAGFFGALAHAGGTAESQTSHPAQVFPGAPVHARNQESNAPGSHADGRGGPPPTSPWSPPAVRPAPPAPARPARPGAPPPPPPKESIRQYDRQIEQLAKAHPDFAIFDSLPGAGEVLVPRLIAAFGTQRDRYANAAEIQQYTGIAPVTEASGQQHWVHWRWSCPKFLRQTFHEWAGQSILYCGWAEAYNRAQRDDKNKSHHAAVRSLAYKWMRIALDRKSVV